MSPKHPQWTQPWAVLAEPNAGSRSLAHLSDADLIRELILRNGSSIGPTSINYVVRPAEVLIGIGKGSTAHLMIPKDALKTLFPERVTAED